MLSCLLFAPGAGGPEGIVPTPKLPCLLLGSWLILGEEE